MSTDYGTEEITERGGTAARRGAAAERGQDTEGGGAGPRRKAGRSRREHEEQRTGPRRRPRRDRGATEGGTGPRRGARGAGPRRWTRGAGGQSGGGTAAKLRTAERGNVERRGGPGLRSGSGEGGTARSDYGLGGADVATGRSGRDRGADGTAGRRGAGQRQGADGTEAPSVFGHASLFPPRRKRGEVSARCGANQLLAAFRNNFYH